MIRRLGARALLASFQTRNYRFFWVSDGLSRWGEQMEFVVLAWFVLVETESPFLVGVFGALRFSGRLLAPLYGIAVDRYNRRYLLAGMRMSFAVVAAVLLLLAFTDGLEVWHVFVLVGARSVARSVEDITRQALLADIMQEGRLMNAVALTHIGTDVALMISPFLGAALLSRAGLGWAYLPIVTMYLAATLLAYRLDPPSRRSTGGATSVLRNLIGLASYTKRQESILALLLLALVINFSAYPLNFGMMPVFARDVVGTGAVGLAVLMWALASGAFLGSVVIASLGHIQRPGVLIAVAMVAWYAALFFLSRSQSLGLVLPILLAMGLAQAFSMVTINVMLLRTSSPELRGRVMGLRSMAVYGLPVGLLLTGALADILGTPTALAINAGMGGALTVFIVVRLKKLWRLA